MNFEKVNEIFNSMSSDGGFDEFREKLAKMIDLAIDDCNTMIDRMKTTAVWEVYMGILLAHIQEYCKGVGAESLELFDITYDYITALFREESNE